MDNLGEMAGRAGLSSCQRAEALYQDETTCCLVEHTWIRCRSHSYVPPFESGDSNVVVKPRPRIVLSLGVAWADALDGGGKLGQTRSRR